MVTGIPELEVEAHMCSGMNLKWRHICAVVCRWKWEDRQPRVFVLTLHLVWDRITLCCPAVYSGMTDLWAPGDSLVSVSQATVSRVCAFQGPNPGPHIYTAGVFITEPFPWPTAGCPQPFFVIGYLLCCPIGITDEDRMLLLTASKADSLLPSIICCFSLP